MVVTSIFAETADRAVGWRQGVIPQLNRVPLSFADVNIANWAATASPFSAGGVSGGAGHDDETARLAAVGEALERYAAARCPLRTTRYVLADEVIWPLNTFTLHSDAQQRNAGFPFRMGYEVVNYTTAWTLPGNEPVWVPAGLVGMDPRYGLPATSTGLAAGISPVRAMLRAVQELVERDALAITWLHQVPARKVPVPDEFQEAVAKLGGDVTVFDLTPDFSPHPVIAIAGTLPLNGRRRPTLGLACRASFSEALQKAWLEWCQGTVFVGMSSDVWPADQVTDFDRHAGYYAGHLAEWAELPLWKGDLVDPPTDSSSSTELQDLVMALTEAGVRLAYRELTTPELAAVGLSVVRVLAPDLTPLHSDHNWPFLGGRTADLAWRYSWAASGNYPSRHPHPLG